MISDKAKKIAVLTAIVAIFGAFAATDASAAVKQKTPKKKVVATKQAKVKTVRIAAVKTEAVEEAIEPTSKCLVQTIKNLNAKAVKQMEADIEKYGKNSEAASAKYKYRLDMAWGAMQDPYCGYGGAYGLTDEIHSFKKSIERARADYLKETKKK